MRIHTWCRYLRTLHVKTAPSTQRTRDPRTLHTLALSSRTACENRSFYTHMRDPCTLHALPPSFTMPLVGKLPGYPGLLILYRTRVSIIIARMAPGSRVITLQDYEEEQRRRFNTTALAALGTMIASPCLALPLTTESSLTLMQTQRNRMGLLYHFQRLHLPLLLQQNFTVSKCRYYETPGKFLSCLAVWVESSLCEFVGIEHPHKNANRAALWEWESGPRLCCFCWFHLLQRNHVRIVWPDPSLLER